VVGSPENAIREALCARLITAFESVKSSSDIIKQLADLKLAMVHTLETVGNQLLDEQKKLTTLQQAIALQSKDLEEIHEIKVNIDTLAAVLHAQKQRKEMFEKDLAEKRDIFERDMQEKRVLWKKEQEETEAVRKEQETQQKKLRQREEEDYIYKRDLERQKERDQYVAQKQLLEKELTDKKATLEKTFAEREASLSLRENELQALQKQAAEFPLKLEKSVAESEKTVTEHLQFKFEYEAKLAQKEVEGEKKLAQQMISALQAKIAQQERQIQELTEKANFAGNQVQEIAVKAIEGASRQPFYRIGYPEKSAETPKN
jgi:colicin import membrane protein